MSSFCNYSKSSYGQVREPPIGDANVRENEGYCMRLNLCCRFHGWLNEEYDCKGCITLIVKVVKYVFKSTNKSSLKVES